MKKLILILIGFTFYSESFSQEKPDSEYETEYIVIAGTSSDYYYLEDKSKKIKKSINIDFDNGGNVYDQKRGIIVPDTSSDEIYAGGYYPRRYPEERISIEMLWYYKDGATEETTRDMIIITGIFGTKEAAQKHLEKVKSIVPTAYIKKKSMYMGCMH